MAEHEKTYRSNRNRQAVFRLVTKTSHPQDCAEEKLQGKGYLELISRYSCGLPMALEVELQRYHAHTHLQTFLTC
ncbi:hypothetical protein M758_4G155000 [Ceratodon purpureus]|nr:hypothetical protein M758_4G155000 [Ceratodon purpureus]